MTITFTYRELENLVFAIYRRDGEGSGGAATRPVYLTVSEGDLDGFSID
jgi:hypothetical protein